MRLCLDQEILPPEHLPPRKNSRKVSCLDVSQVKLSIQETIQEQKE